MYPPADLCDWNIRNINDASGEASIELIFTSYFKETKKRKNVDKWQQYKAEAGVQDYRGARNKERERESEKFHEKRLQRW